MRDPMRNDPYSERDEPIRPNIRTLVELPSCSMSSMLSEEPSCATPYKDWYSPMRAQLRMDIEDEMNPHASSTESELPSCAVP